MEKLTSDNQPKTPAEEEITALALLEPHPKANADRVFAAWAAALEREGEGDPELLAAELAKLERKGPPSPAGEWLAEAAAEGSLHEPGAMFHSLESRPFPSAAQRREPDEGWRAILPPPLKPQEGLRLIMRYAAEAAARRADGPDGTWKS
ncbi:hypothetical protein [Paenibacillus sp. NFR01]|uniref:hypothetical protein n=1 Tax=Paenibacillus sp. NFR01 TaxID=1566279 RepID=UPI0008D89A43|nr:hypothetical protein [Paenibacillus sp. NFR01]SEU29788.1 hypothetical protein SAMN03159358_4834 [Paenibacillus sp. NFR01]